MKVERVVITPEQVAAMFGVNPKTVTRWSNNGRLKHAFKTPGGHRRYYLDEIEKLIKGDQP